MSETQTLRSRLRAQKVFGGELPKFDTDVAPGAPLPLLVEWLEAAMDAGVVQPHAMALATVSGDGDVSNRTLLMKDVDSDAVWFASLDNGPKGQDIRENPRVALALYWREQGRQVRIVGHASEGPRATSEKDFRERHPNARAMAIAAKQSEPIENYAERVDAARQRIEDDPDFVPQSWTAYRVVPESIEFWQAERERDQVRLRYRRVGDGWEKDLLWP